MSRNRVHLLVDLLAYLAMAGLVATGSIMYFRLPPGSGSDALLGLTRHQWGGIHAYTAISLVGLVVLHVVLHWKWVANTFGALLPRKEPKKAGAGAGASILLVVLGAVAAAAIAMPWLAEVQQGAGRGRGEGKGFHGGLGRSESPQSSAEVGSPALQPKGDGEAKRIMPRPGGAATPVPQPGEHAGGQGEAIRGNSTLAEVADAAGVPLARILTELRLPADTPAIERLGRLRQQYGFTMEDIRNVVVRLQRDAKP